MELAEPRALLDVPHGAHLQRVLLVLLVVALPTPEGGRPAVGVADGALRLLLVLRARGARRRRQGRLVLGCVDADLRWHFVYFCVYFLGEVCM
ncbi:hypothetical protein F5B20DRAFT_535405 [Whalleya microplaca]|nr:hypothetical protein F5B20DRAFT_535405 [Whalleya microplaca]